MVNIKKYSDEEAKLRIRESKKRWKERNRNKIQEYNKKYYAKKKELVIQEISINVL